ncbi:MAG: bifunctional phosphoribosylaminoimidazolecarboxamide formyltransferase/IMP cyclohydrolase PurH [Ignavibacteriae bacterium]|nr:MAG: bifunctional phosphoribosylaminoimidazolecarboxamide formyltransferase/IMP cyclohydrolase PurH [Ignavibacteriota bacterium]
MKRALISVYDKTNVVEFAKELVNKGFEIISTSGTAKLLTQNGIEIKTIEEITKSPEILNGRVKTLHPIVFAGLLADKENKLHIEQMNKFNMEFIDLLVVNLYPFAETIRKEDCTMDEAIEQIDIGGVSLIRAAAKNYKSVSVIIKPQQYKKYLSKLAENTVDTDFNLCLASKAFNYISDYDNEIANYFSRLHKEHSGLFSIPYSSSAELRYGENPHQKGTLLNTNETGFDEIFDKIHGKDLSYINILDIDASYNLINEFDEPACAIIKHTNPSGVACDKNIKDAYIKALACDNVSRFGGIIIVNREMDLETAQEIDKIKTDIVLAPSYNADAMEFLLKKKNRVLIKYNKSLDIRYKHEHDINVKELKSVTGGLLIQDSDDIVVDEKNLKVVTDKKPTENEIRDLIFAMKVCKHTKSNSVVYAKNLQTVGIGGGQPSRIDSSRLAVEKARRFGMDLEGCSVASDAFFPFADGVIEAANAGARSVIQPGGSMRDEEVIKAANENGMCMIFSGLRHFKH